jgi:glycolate oxidase FAD binding subunit
MNTWAGSPLPITATCFDGERVFVRLGGAESAIAQAADSIGGETVEEATDFWHRQIREQGHNFFAGEKPLWRLSLPSAAPSLDLPGKQFLEWGGAQRWYRGAEEPGRIREAAAEAGGHATLFRGGDRNGQVFQPIGAALIAVHRNLKRAFDPAGLLNPGRLFAEL